MQCQGNFFVYHVTESTYSGIIFRAIYELYKELEKFNCITVNSLLDF